MTISQITRYLGLASVVAIAVTLAPIASPEVGVVNISTDSSRVLAVDSSSASKPVNQLKNTPAPKSANSLKKSTTCSACRNTGRQSCTACLGSGTATATYGQPCGHCAGLGVRICPQPRCPFIDPQIGAAKRTCRMCQNSGWWRCTTCLGTGQTVNSFGLGNCPACTGNGIRRCLQINCPTRTK